MEFRLADSCKNRFVGVASRKYFILLAIFIISLAIRIWLLDQRWINPDEGAHLMDGVFVLDGLIPMVDFGSRQPLYVFVNALMFKLFGVSYITGRILPLSCSILAGLFIFLIGRRLFDENSAILSTIIYWLLPLEVLNSVVVKTEPMVTLLLCISFYLAIRGTHDKKKGLMILSGVFGAMAFYIRQSALIIPIVIFVYLMIDNRGKLQESLRQISLFLSGYVGIVLCVIVFYLKYLEVSTILLSGSLDPLGFIWGSLIKNILFFATYSGSPIDASSIGFARSSGIREIQYYQYMKWAVLLHSFLIMGVFYSFVQLLRKANFKKHEEFCNRYIRQYLFLYLWISFLFLAYVYFFITRGFFIDYFREFLPPLVLIFSGWLVHTEKTLNEDGYYTKIISITLLCSFVLFFLQSKYAPFSKPIQLSITITIFTFAYLFHFVELKRHRIALFISLIVAVSFIIGLYQDILTQSISLKYLISIFLIGTMFILPVALFKNSNRFEINNYLKFIAITLIAGTFVVSISYSAELLDTKYDSVWSPQSVDKVSEFINSHTEKNAKVMSGAVIWELQARRRPFNRISHPLTFLSGMTKKDRKNISSAIINFPPQIIVQDGYLEKIYFRQLPWFKAFIEKKYSVAASDDRSKYPVLIFERKSN